MAHTPWNKGKKGLKKNPYLAELNRSRKGIPRNDFVKAKISATKFGKPNPAAQGDKNRHWKGGVNPVNNTIRKSSVYGRWMLKVFKRDNFTCTSCGVTDTKKRVDGGVLNAHHIKSFAEYPELRLVVSNGITLCAKCHKQEHGLNKK